MAEGFVEPVVSMTSGEVAGIRKSSTQSLGDLGIIPSGGYYVLFLQTDTLALDAASAYFVYRASILYETTPIAEGASTKAPRVGAPSSGGTNQDGILTLSSYDTSGGLPVKYCVIKIA